MQHHYVVTHPIPAFMEPAKNSGDSPIPTLRLFAQEQKSRLMGIYEPPGARSLGSARISGMGIFDEIVPDDLERIARARAGHRADAPLGEVEFGASSTAPFRTPPTGRPARTAAV